MFLLDRKLSHQDTVTYCFLMIVFSMFTPKRAEEPFNLSICKSGLVKTQSILGVAELFKMSMTHHFIVIV